MKPPKLIAITKTIIPDGSNLAGHMIGAEEFIAYAARLSNPSNQMNHGTSAKLLTYLVKNSHWSPFDMVDMIVEVTTSKAIAIQMLRHWSFRFQEFSQRYATVEELDYSHVEIREKAVGGNRQGSGAVLSKESNSAQGVCQVAVSEYQWAISHGAAPESARMVLPMATLTTLYAKASVRSWMTYFWQRLDPHAQKEHRELAQEIFTIFAAHFPITANLVKTYKPQVIEL